MIPILISAVYYFSRFLTMVIFARVIMSWFPNMRHGLIGQFLFSMSEPIIGPVRKLLQKTPLGAPGMMLDFAPLASFMLIWVAESLIIGFLRGLM